MNAPHVFFPNGSVRMPPANGPDVHRFELVRHLTELGASVTTLQPDQNPHATHIPRSFAAVVRMLREADGIYCRLNEGFQAAQTLTLPGVRRLIPPSTPVLWEANLAPSISVRVQRRENRAIQRTQYLLRAAAARVDVAIGVTEPVSAELRDVLRMDRVVTIPNAADPRRFGRLERSATRSRPLKCVWIPSQNNAIHDFELVEATAARIDERGLPVTLDVIGSDELPLASRNCLKVRPALPYDRLADALTGFDVGLVLYRHRVDRGSPLKLFDYLAAGCVPVCSPGAGVEEIIDETLGFVGDWTPISLAELLLRLRDSEDELVTARENGWKAIDSKYNWRNAASRILDLMEDARRRRSTSFRQVS